MGMVAIWACEFTVTQRSTEEASRKYEQGALWLAEIYHQIWMGLDVDIWFYCK